MPSALRAVEPHLCPSTLLAARAASWGTRGAAATSVAARPPAGRLSVRDDRRTRAATEKLHGSGRAARYPGDVIESSTVRSSSSGLRTGRRSSTRSIVEGRAQPAAQLRAPRASNPTSRTAGHRQARRMRASPLTSPQSAGGPYPDSCEEASENPASTRTGAPILPTETTLAFAGRWPTVFRSALPWRRAEGCTCRRTRRSSSGRSGSADVHRSGGRHLKRIRSAPSRATRSPRTAPKHVAHT